MAQLEGKTALITGGTSVSVMRRREPSPTSARCSSPGVPNNASTRPQPRWVRRRRCCQRCRTEDLDRLVGVIRDAGAGLDNLFFTNAGSGEFARWRANTRTPHRHVQPATWAGRCSPCEDAAVTQSQCLDRSVRLPPRPPGYPGVRCLRQQRHYPVLPDAPEPPSWATAASGSTRSYPVPS